MMSLGNREYKLLNLSGYKKPLIKPPSPSTEELKAQGFKGDEWPITQEMLNDALKVDYSQ